MTPMGHVFQDQVSSGDRIPTNATLTKIDRKKQKLDCFRDIIGLTIGDHNTTQSRGQVLKLKIIIWIPHTFVECQFCNEVRAKVSYFQAEELGFKVVPSFIGYEHLFSTLIQDGDFARHGVITHESSSNNPLKYHHVNY